MLIKESVDASVKLGNRGWRKMTLYIVSTFSSHIVCIISLYKTELYFYWSSTSNSLLFKWESWKHQFFQTVGNFRQHYCTFYGSFWHHSFLEYQSNTKFLPSIFAWISIKCKIVHCCCSHCSLMGLISLVLTKLGQVAHKYLKSPN